MADIPTPRSYNQILGSMIAAFLARYPIRDLKVGGPILSILEAAAQSDLRNTADTFTALASSSLESSEGTALDNILAEEDTERLGAKAATGLITVTDTRYTKLSSVLFQGQPAPLVGSATLYVADAAGWPVTGSLYIGRNTEHYEGPLLYTAITPPSGGNSYYTITLDVFSRTAVYHNVGESVIVAQGGDRLIPAGTLVQTPQGNVSSAIQFSTLYAATLADGEMSVSGVQIVCTKPGKIGNVVAGAITEFVAPPFSGATCSNETAFNDGTEIETDDEARARIRKLRQSRVRGTKTAIEAKSIGVVATDENKRIASSSLVSRESEPAVLYIDDGSGYEEQAASLPYEVLTNSAIGGEQYFQLSMGRPVTKAYVSTISNQPWAIRDGSVLSVEVGGKLYEHTFTTSDFRNIANAAAFEVAHSINANPTLAFSARTTNNGQGVSIFAKADTNEYIQVVPSTTLDANSVLNFPTNLVETCRLFKNDVLLSKDGQPASITSNPQANWASITSGATLILNVDNTGAVTYTINDVDFVLADTNYLSVSQLNSLASWVAVLNYKIPGITAEQVGNTIVISSNVGTNSRGALAITGGTLVTSQMFPITSSTAKTKDYTLDRNLGQLKLTTPLLAGDVLSAGSPSTQAFIESDVISTPISLGTGTMYVVVDSAAQIIPLPYTSSTTFTETSTAYGGATYIDIVASSPVFASVAIDDWIILTDSQFTNPGAYRVAQVISTSRVSIRKSSIVAGNPAAPLNNGGIAVVRTVAPVQKVTISSGGFYTAESIAAAITSQLEGAHAEVVRTGRFRIVSNSRGPTSDILYIIGTLGLANLPLASGVLKTSNTSHVAYSVSGNAENSIPHFNGIEQNISGVSSTVLIDVLNSSLLVGNEFGNLGDIYTGLRGMTYDAIGAGIVDSTNLNWATSVTDISTATPLHTILTVREPAINSSLNYDRLYQARPFNLGAMDDISIILDNDTASKRFDFKMSRRLNTSVGAYQTTGLTIRDYPNNSSIGAIFGSAFDFNDYALVMHPRVVTDTGTAREVLWRWNGLGRGGEFVGFEYAWPLSANQATTWFSDPYTNANPMVGVTLPSGAARTLSGLTTGVRISAPSRGRTAGGTTPYRYHLLTGLQITDYVVAAGVATITLSWPAALTAITDHGLQIGDTVFFDYNGGVPLLDTAAVITNRTATTVSYATADANTGPAGAGAYGWCYFDSVTGANWTGAVVGDVITINAAAGLPADVTGKAMYVEEITAGFNNLSLIVLTDSGSAAATTLPHPTATLGSTSRISEYTVGGTVPTILAALPPTTTPFTGVSSQVGSITGATWYTSNSTARPIYRFLDGLNFVKTTNAAADPGNYTIDLKNAVAASLANNANWSTEEVYLVPMTAKNVAGFLNALPTNGLSANGEVFVANHGRVQVASSTIGSNSIVDIRGGTANSATCSIRGAAAFSPNNDMYVHVPTVETSGINGYWFAEIANTSGIYKSNAISSTTLTSINAGTRTWTVVSSVRTGQITISNQPVRFEKQGNYVAIKADTRLVNPDFSMIDQGYVTISNGSGTVSAANSGTFQVLGLDAGNDIFWIENPDCVEEYVNATLVFNGLNAMMPGDILTLNATTWGVGNKRSFTIDSVASNGLSFVTVETPETSGAAGAIGAAATLRSGTTQKFIKKVLSIVPHPTDASLSVMHFSGNLHYNAIGANYGSTITALGKLGFGVNVATGTDGYKYNTGLIGEANHVLYGIETDPVAYPGVIAAGANVNINGPLVRRVQISLSLRIRRGSNQTAVFDAVRSAVAAYINNIGVGQSIAISDIVAVANAIGGVEAVSVYSPVYNSGSDRISVQPYEKPMVLQPEVDIGLTLVS